MQLGKLQVLSARMLIPWTGPWSADLELDIGSSDPLPTGAQVLSIAQATLKGTIDVRGTGHIGEKATARLVAGGNGWGNIVPRRYFGNDAAAGVTSKDVTTATASEIGEQVVDGAPLSYGPTFTRVAGRASQVLDSRDWYLDALGVTQIASWPTLQPSDDVTVLSYDPELRRAAFASDTLVWPGTVFSDSRFETLTARDIELTFDRDGARGVLWHSGSAAGRLGAGLEAMIDGFGQTAFLKVYRYRIVEQVSDGRLRLQAVSKTAGMPDTLPITVWPGIPGLTAKWSGDQLGLTVAVVFLEGDPTLPRVVGFDGRAPTELHFDAATLIEMGAGAQAFAARGDTFDAFYNAVNVFASTTPLVTIPQVAAAFAALKLAISNILTATQATIVKVK